MVDVLASARLRVRAVICCALLALAGGALALMPASAGAAGPTYGLSISEGSSTSPEFIVSGVSAFGSGGNLLRVTITRGGTVVAQSPAQFGFAFMSPVPQPGDVVNVESPPGAVVAGVTYDGLPSLDPTVCVGSRSFSGQRRPNATVSGGYYSLGLVTSPYGSGLGLLSFGEATVSTLSGSVFAGSFLTALTAGDTVFASQEETSAAPGGGTFFYLSENTRPVGACPLPPAPASAIGAKVAPPHPGPIALAGQVVKSPLASIRRLLKSGWLQHVFINQPGTVIQNLYLQNGSLPAFAAKHKHAALLVAKGSTTATHAGTVNVLLRATTRGRRALKHVRRAKLVLITTLKSASGARISLARYAFSLKH
ncbi:MAG TPA: hypothetical protein VGN08_12265 [Solirubrobacteraceae bacterium]